MTGERALSSSTPTLLVYAFEGLLAGPYVSEFDLDISIWPQPDTGRPSPDEVRVRRVS
jgi:hypothetical protein